MCEIQDARIGVCIRKLARLDTTIQWQNSDNTRIAELKSLAEVIQAFWEKAFLSD